jgi:pimeloyl-ACP methyl ester carboxylesterase
MRRRGQWIPVACVLAVCALPTTAGGAADASAAPIMRVELHLAPGARSAPHLLLMTLGGPIYCRQLLRLATAVDASLACADYGPNTYEAPGQRAGRLEDWGDPAYDAAAAQLPDRLRREGVEISKLVLVGVSYSGFANAELVASHPELKADALVVVDSYLDLAARYGAIYPGHPTQTEIVTAVGGTPDTRPDAYAARSPSHHLATLAAEVKRGMQLVVVWSVAAGEQHEFNGATCGRLANAEWLSRLASLVRRPVTGYVTTLPHAHALWDRGQALLGFAGVWHGGEPLLARLVAFKPGLPPPPSSYCKG